MNIDLGISLEKNNIYSSSGNIFSRLILLKKIIQEEQASFIICENENRIRAYINIAKELGLYLSPVTNLFQIIDLFHNKRGNYVVSKDIFDLDINIEKSLFKIEKGVNISPQDLAKKLNELNIEFSEYQNPNSFFISGDLLNYTDNSGQLVKISFWDEEIDMILYGEENIDFYVFGANVPISNIPFSNKTKTLLKLLEDNFIFTTIDSIDFYDIYDDLLLIIKNYIIFTINTHGNSVIDLGFKDLIIQDLEELKNILNSNNSNKLAITKNTKLIDNFVDLNNIDSIKVLFNSSNKLKSFSFANGFVICDDNISRIFVKKRLKRSLSENMDLLLQIKKGDYVVHIDHGVGVFSDIIEREISGIKKEYLLIEYKNDDKLYVPLSEISRITKYVGVESPNLTSLSTKEWEKKLKKASEDANIIASELLEIYAKRKIQKGFKFLAMKEEENKFFSSFEFVYTDDQYSVINDIFKDMEASTPMDRLISGDVGFGKTEVAFASIYKSIINGRQAALISPLVVLAYEHYEKAKERFINFPFNIRVLTRFETASETKEILKNLEEGKIDLVIGTHRLLSEDIKFSNLGLLVIDEEHKFGVKDKEKIKKLKGNIDILSMSATPIPRSLNMALNGLKEVSMLTTPPVGKQAIETIVSPFNEELIFSAGKKEFDRSGQIFFIHNRVETILAMQAFLEKLFPGKKVIVAHGQLSGDSLEKRIIAFKNREYDILLATTVIENGIDFQNVNTIFINDANNFGISQIHQLRGRVGRGYEKAYAYLLFKKDKIKEDAAKRLKTIVDYSHLGAGFELAVKDLELRGGGDILGIKQSGSSVEVGISLFLEMLESRIEELKAENDLEDTSGIQTKINTSIDLNVEAFIANDFFASDLDKLNFYREIESIRTIEELELIINGFEELDKKMNKSTANLFSLLKLKIAAFNYKILSVRRVGINYQIDFNKNITIDELKLFLDLDMEYKFVVINQFRLRTSIKNFTSDEKFVEYLLLIFEKRLGRKKIKIKKKV